jgi:hypothetical protein
MLREQRTFAALESLLLSYDELISFAGTGHSPDLSSVYPPYESV